MRGETESRRWGGLQCGGKYAVAMFCVRRNSECEVAVKYFRNPTGIQPLGVDIKGKGLADSRGLGLSGLS